MTNLATRWRPERFEEVVGQEQVTKILRRSVERQRLATAYLLQGSRGTGKTTTARILARAIMCQEPEAGEPCRSCGPCEATPGAGRGYVEMDAASNRSTVDMRNLEASLKEEAATTGGRAYIVDEVHMLTPGARTALQELIESEPAETTLILCTTEAHELPETLRTRCQEHRFRRLRNADVTAHLAKVCKAEGIAADRKALELIGHAADGGMRDALQLLEQATNASQEGVDQETVHRMLGGHIRQTITSLTRHLLAGNERDAVIAAQAATGEGAEPRQIHDETTARLNDALAIAWGQREAEDLPQTVRAALRNANWRRTADILWEWSSRRPATDARGLGQIEQAIAAVCARNHGT